MPDPGVKPVCSKDNVCCSILCYRLTKHTTVIKVEQNVKFTKQFIFHVYYDKHNQYPFIFIITPTPYARNNLNSIKIQSLNIMLKLYALKTFHFLYHNVKYVYNQHKALPIHLLIYFKRAGWGTMYSKSMEPNVTK